MIVHTIQIEQFLTSVHVSKLLLVSGEKMLTRDRRECNSPSPNRRCQRRCRNAFNAGERYDESEQAECNNTFRQHMSEQTEHLNGHVERTLRFHEKMDQRVTAVEGMVQQQGRHIEQINHNVTVVQGTVQQQGRHLQQIDHDVTDVQGTVQQHDRQLQQVMREMDDLREAYRTLNGRLDSEEATIERERVVDDNQDARKPSGFDVEERFSGLEKLLPEPGKGGFMEKASSFFYGKKVIVGKEFSCSCHTRADIVSLVKSFGGIVFKNVVAGSGEYRSLSWCIV